MLPPFLCLCAAATWWPVWAASDERALAVLERTSAYYQGLENFRAIYQVTVQHPEDDALRTVELVLTARGPQYRWSYDQKETITDGETVWVYDKEIQEVTISDYATTDCPLNFAELYNLYQKGYEPRYLKTRVTGTGSNKKSKKRVVDAIGLTPKEEDAIFQHITLEIDRATARIHGWEMVQTEETRYICTLRSFAENLPLKDDWFSFDPSKHQGLEIIDLRNSEPDVASENGSSELDEASEEEEEEATEPLQTDDTP